jgi:hypothetical protein
MPSIQLDAGIERKPRDITVQQCRRCAEEACEVAIAHEQADAKADVVLLDS